MATWTKIKPNYNNGEARQSFAVTRQRSSNRQARLVVPANAPEHKAERCSIYSDGNGKLAFAFGSRGEYTVTQAGAGIARCVTIPASIAGRIPYGTTDVTVIRDGDMIVLDLAAIPQNAA